MAEAKRVRDKDTGAIYTTRAYDPEAHEVLAGAAALDHIGRPYPAVFPGTKAAKYEESKVADLQDEIKRRNAARDEADHLPSTGKKPDLIAALTADDRTQEGS